MDFPVNLTNIKVAGISILQTFILDITGLNNIRFGTNCIVTLRTDSTNPYLEITNLELTCREIDLNLGFGIGTYDCPSGIVQQKPAECITSERMPYQPRIMAKNVLIKLDANIDLSCCKTTKLMSNYKLTNPRLTLNMPANGNIRDVIKVTFDSDSSVFSKLSCGFWCTTETSVPAGLISAALATGTLAGDIFYELFTTILTGGGGISFTDLLITYFGQPIMAGVIKKIPPLPIGCTTNSNMWCNVSSNVKCGTGEFECLENNQVYTFSGPNANCKYSPNCGIKKIKTGTTSDRYIVYIRRANLNFKQDSNLKTGMSTAFKQSKTSPSFWLNTCVPDILQNTSNPTLPSTPFSQPSYDPTAVTLR